MASKSKYKRIQLLKPVKREGGNVTITHTDYNKMKNLLIANPDLMVHFYNGSKVPKMRSKYSRIVYRLTIDDGLCGETLFNTTKRWKVAIKALWMIVNGKMKEVTQRFDGDTIRMTVKTTSSVKLGKLKLFIDRKEII